MTLAASARGRVIVIGAGPVGLSAAVELGLRGIPVTVVDPVVELSERVHPRARIVNLRSTEHFRRWGVADTVRKHSSFGPDWPSLVQFRTTLAGYEIASFEDAFFTAAPPSSAPYPEPTIQIRQVDVEFGLRERLADLPGVKTLYGYEAVEVSQDDEGVQVTARSRDGELISLAGAYLIGADGGRSLVRRSLGFTMTGQTAVSRNVQIQFEVPGLFETLGLEPGMQYWCLTGDFPGFVQTTSPNNEFILSVHKLDDIDAFIKDHAWQAVRQAIGADIPFTITGVDPWVIHARIADTYRRGRAFLVGDAARQHSTFGAHGMNVGISDAADLGWKLAAVVQGWAPPELLDTFTLERRPVGVEVLEQASRSFTKAPVDLVVPGMDDSSPRGNEIREALRATILREKASQYRHIGTQLGYRYSDSPLIVGDGTSAPEWVPNSYTPSATPGSLAPHAWLADGASIYDKFGPWFTLLDLGGGDPPAADAMADAGQEGVPASLVRVRSAELSSLYQRRFAIIRPDQHVAWRGDDLPGPDVWAAVAGRRLTLAPERA